ncbi:MAG: hypothetical protein K2L22_05625, partial [Muribaculaceae bacterium]|nr:hypothetical protein [Muribaculaceae bacterium]
EFCYNAFPFMFPTSQNSAITEILSDRPQKLQGTYTLDGRKVEEADKGIYIIDGKKTPGSCVASDSTHLSLILISLIH